MEIKKEYILRHLHEIAIEQISYEYMQNGYSVYKNQKIGKYEVDLILRKENEQIAIQIKSERLTPIRKEYISMLADYINSLGSYKFLIVLATPPKEKEIEIDEFENLILKYFLTEFPDELMELSTHTSIEEIIDVEISKLTVKSEAIIVEGNGIANVKLQFGSDGDQERNDGYSTYDNYGFNFIIDLYYDENDKLFINNVIKLTFDTSSFYE